MAGVRCFCDSMVRGALKTLVVRVLLDGAEIHDCRSIDGRTKVAILKVSIRR